MAALPPTLRPVPLAGRRAVALRALVAVPLGALLAWLQVGAGFLNYDTAYFLLWGDDLAHGRLPDLSVPVAPTQHPLATVLGALLEPLGGAGETVWVVLAFVSLGALGWLCFELGAAWFGRAAGVFAAVLILTRIPVLSFGVRAYVDIPYVALVLGALLAETRRRPGRGGAGALVLLGLAGLLRPEAWLLAFAYLAWLWFAGERGARRLAPLVALACAGPLLWALSDWIVAGDPLHSLTGTRSNAEVLQRRTGLGEVPLTVPRRIGEILREPALLGALVGGVLALWHLRRRALLPIAAGVAALLAFCLLAAAGLPILGRYLLLPAALLAVFCGAGAFAFRLAPGRGWAVAAGVVWLAFAAFAPGQVDRIRSLRAAMGTQQRILGDLHDLSRTRAFRAGCRPVAVPNHRPVPHLALWTGIAPAAIVSAQLSRPASGLYVDPASARVERNFTLDPNDPRRLTARVPAGFTRVAANASWVLYARC